MIDCPKKIKTIIFDDVIVVLTSQEDGFTSLTWGADSSAFFSSEEEALAWLEEQTNSNLTRELAWLEEQTNSNLTGE